MSVSAPPTAEPVIDEAAQGVTSPTKIIHQQANAKWSSLRRALLVFMKADIEVMFKKERDNATTVPKTLDLKGPYSKKVAEKEFPTDYKVPKF